MSGCKKNCHRAFVDMTPAEKKIHWRTELMKRTEDQIILNEIMAELKRKNEMDHASKLAEAQEQLDALTNMRK
jgi:hypothetical protein